MNTMDIVRTQAGEDFWMAIGDLSKLEVECGKLNYPYGKMMWLILSTACSFVFDRLYKNGYTVTKRK